MRKLEAADLKDIAAYEKVRAKYRAGIIALKKHRRVQVGPKVSLVFENRDTLTFQIQEMMRAERIVRDEAIAAELEVYNLLIPGPDELSATLFIEIPDQSVIKQELLRLLGLDAPGVLKMVIGGTHEVAGEFEAGRSKEDKISSVHYVRFHFSPEAQAAFRAPDARVEISIDHPNYRQRTILDKATRRSLAQDFAA